MLGEQALHTRLGTLEEHADQLNHLLALMRLPFVSVDIIPADVHRQAIATIGFWIFDNNAVALETPTAASRSPGRRRSPATWRCSTGCAPSRSGVARRSTSLQRCSRPRDHRRSLTGSAGRQDDEKSGVSPIRRRR